MKYKLISAIAGILSLSASAQQDAGFSQYFFNQLYINPAYAGSRNALSGTLVHRSQWIDMPGAPVTQSFTLHSPVPHTRAGVGLQAYNDRSGPISNTGLQATYSYYIPVGKYRLAFGLAGSLHNMRVSWDDIQVDDKSDPSFQGNSYSWVPDASGGVYLYRERFYAGFSSTHLFQSQLGLANADVTNPAKFYRTYYLTTGMVFKMNETIDFRPSILIKRMQSSPFDFDLNASFIFYKKLFAGAGFRTSKRINLDGTDNQLIAIIEYHIKSFRIGYSYDWYLNRTGTYNSGTHEIMVGFDLNFNKTKMTSPIFF